MLQSLTNNFNDLHEASTTYKSYVASSAKSLRGSGFRLRGLFLSILRWGVGFEGMEKTSRDRGYFIDCSQKRGFVGLRRFVKAADLSDELQRSGSNLLGIHGRIEIEESFDISAHSAWPQAV
jgi:hypothetical protein